MNKPLLAASALALAATMSPALTSSVQAQSAGSPYCDMAKGQKNLVSWNAYYHCLGPAPRATQTHVRARPTFRNTRSYPAYGRPVYAAEQTKDPYCDMAKGQKNLVSWNAYYHCLGPAPQARQSSLEARPMFDEARPSSGRPLYAEAGTEQVKSPYCDMAKSQKNPVAWNAYYGCLSR